MKKIELSAFDLAQRFVGIKEVRGELDNPQIMAMLQLDMKWPEDDEVPWCSAFVNYICWLLRLPRSKSLRARSWLTVGYSVAHPQPGFDIVIFKRGRVPQPGPDVLDAPGHIGFYAGWQDNNFISVLGGNQANTVRVSSYPATALLDIRRLYG